MSAIPVVIAENGRGVPVRPVETGAPVMTVAENGLGAPIVLSDTGTPFVVEGLAQQPIFYVDPAGSDSNDGLSPGSAWQTLAKVNASTFNAGERVLFKGGSTFSGQLVLREGQHYGAPGDPIVYGSYGAGKATIQTAANAQAGIDALNPHDVTIQDLIVIGTGSSVSASCGIDCVNDLLGNSKLPGLSILRCEVSAFGRDGIGLRTGDTAYAAESASGWDAPLIDGCVAHDCTGNALNGATAVYGTGIHIQGLWGLAKYPVSTTNPVIRNCISYNNSGKTGVAAQGNGIMFAEVSNGLIENCLSYNNGTLSDGSVGIWMHDCIDSTIRFCVARNQKTRLNTPDGGGYDIDGGAQNCTIEYCYSADNHGMGYMLYQYGEWESFLLPFSGNVVRYCISQNDATQNAELKGSLLIGSGEARDAPNNWMYGNTVYQSGTGRNAFDIGSESGITRFVNGGFVNNILVAANGSRLINSGGSQVPPASFLMRGNLYWTAGGAVSIKWGATTYASIAAWRIATGKETSGGVDTSMPADPKFVGPVPIGNVNTVLDTALHGYETLLGSGAQGYGQNILSLIGITPPRDFFGNTVPRNEYDIGAFESATKSMLLLGTPVTTAQQNVAYSGFTVTARGGVAPYTYSVASGSLPDGIALNSSTGAVSGTPTTIEVSSNIVLRATDVNGQTADLAPFNIDVTALGPNLMDGVSWVARLGAASPVPIVGGRARAERATDNPRINKLLTGLQVGATYSAVGGIYKETASGDIWFRVATDANMTTNKVLEVGPSGVNVAVNTTFVATATSLYVGLVCVAAVNGQYASIDDNFAIRYVSGP